MAGFGALQLGELDQAEQLLSDVEDAMRAFDDQWTLALVAGHRAIVSLRRGDYQRALRQISEPLALSRESGDRLGLYTALYIHARASLENGDLASASFTEALQATIELRDRVASAYCLQGAARVLQAQGDPVGAVRQLGLAGKLLEGLASPRWAFLPEPEAQERTVSALRRSLSDAAFDSAWRAGYRMPLDDLAASMTDFTDERGEPDWKQSHTPGVRQPGNLAERLTPRELDVLRLLTAGSSTDEIAESLFISRETARTHIRNILGKLALPSRSAAVAWVFAHGLVDSD